LIMILTVKNQESYSVFCTSSSFSSLGSHTPTHTHNTNLYVHPLTQVHTHLPYSSSTTCTSFISHFHRFNLFMPTHTTPYSFTSSQEKLLVWLPYFYTSAAWQQSSLGNTLYQISTYEFNNYNF